VESLGPRDDDRTTEPIGAAFTLLSRDTALRAGPGAVGAGAFDRQTCYRCPLGRGSRTILSRVAYGRAVSWQCMLI